MNKFIYLKVLILVAALAIVFYIMTHMSPGKVEAGMANVGLPEAGGAATPLRSAGSESEQINLCHTRIQAIIWPDGRKVQEFKDGMKLKWQAYNLDPSDIGYMDMEKWLSLHCEVAASARDASASAFKPFVTIDYIDGTKEELARANGGVYRFGGKTFVSPDLEKAISDLISLANLRPQGP